jgi:alginate O-acetyltransferase complex protein AlgI
LHGTYLAAERWLRGRGWAQRLPMRWPQKLALILLTWLLIDIAWVLFRANSLTAAWQLLTSMSGVNSNAPALLPTVLILETLFTIAGILAVHSYLRERTLEGVVARMPWWVVGSGWAAMLFAVIITQDSGNAFSYFQF